MLILVLFVHLVLLVFTQFTLWPEMVVYPYLLNNRFLLYKDIVNPYPPFFTYFLSLFSGFFGYKPFPYQLLTWILILLTDLLIYKTSQKIFGKKYAILSTLFFALMSVPFLINGLWYDLVQVPLIILSLLYFLDFLKSRDKRSIFRSSLCLTIAFLIKQQILWLAFFLIGVFIYKFRFKSAKVIYKNYFIFLPLLVFLALESVFFLNKGTFSDFLFWNFNFPFFRASLLPGYILFPTFKQAFIVICLFLFFLPTILKRKFESNFLLGCAFLSLMFAYPRFDYFHLISALAILSLLAGINFQNFFKLNNLSKLVFFATLVILLVFTIRYFMRNWTREVRFFEKDITDSATAIKEMLKPGERLYIQNGPDQLFALTSTFPVKPWVDEFPWYLGEDKLQTEVVKELILDKPDYIVFKPYDIGDSYSLGVYKPIRITTYLDDNYKNFRQISPTLWLKARNEK